MDDIIKDMMNMGHKPKKKKKKVDVLSLRGRVDLS